MGLSSETLISEVRHLLDGRLVIPSIQRGYVWRRAQVPHLLDSLYRGYPVGSLLVWKTSLDVPLKRAAVLQHAQEQHRPAVLLDGQQRLTSLAKVVAPDRVVGGALDVRFDVHEETFLNPSAAQRSASHLVSVSELLSDAPQFAAVLARAGITPSDSRYDAFYDRVRKVHDIRGALLPVMTIESDDYEEVAEIFARVNQGGRRLSKGDLVYSAIAARWPEGLERIDAFNDELDRRNFALDREAVLRLTGLLAGTGSHVIKLIGRSITGDHLRAAWEETETALRFAVDFLVGECKVPRSAVLSSPNVAVIPAYLLHLRQNRLAPEETQALRQWVYTSMAFSYYSNQVEGKLDADARLARERTGPHLFDELVRRASGARPTGTPIEPQELTSKKSTSPWFNLLYIAVLRSGARDWLGNTTLLALPMTSESKIEYHHVFPRSRMIKEYGRDATDSIANLAFVSGASNRSIGAKPAAAYLPTVPAERLSEQGIPLDPSLWEHDSFESFLAARQVALAETLNDLLGLRQFVNGSPHDVASELPDDDDVFDPESELSPAVAARPRSHGRTSPGPLRRTVARHVIEVFAAVPAGTELSIGEIAAFPSTQYGAGEISRGAIHQALGNGGVPGVEIVPGSALPMRVRRTGGSTN